MALNKVQKNDEGVDVEYWRVKTIVADADSGTIVYVQGYINEQARNDSRHPAENKSFIVDIDIKQYDKKIMDKCYDEIKKNTFFTGASDV